MENNNEKPHFERIVGLNKEDRLRQAEIETYVSQKLFEHGGKRIEGLEIDKTERDVELINFVKNAIVEYTKEYTEKNYDIPLENIHVFKPGGVDEFTEHQKGTGAAAIEYGSIIVDRVESDTEFVSHIFHEILHLNSYSALQLKKNEEGVDIGTYRSGIEITARKGEKVFFGETEEAIIELLTKRFYREKVLPSDIFVKEDKKDFSGSTTTDIGQFHVLIDGLWEKNKDQFKAREEVEDMFIEAEFTGNLLKIGRLVEKTFGKGSFRKLGEGNLIEA